MPVEPLRWDAVDAQGQPLTWDSGLLWDGVQVTPPNIHMPALNVRLTFATGTDHYLEETGTQVSSKLYSVAVFAGAPVTELELNTARTAFSQSVGAATQGGPQQTADKANKRAILVAMLRELANFVQGKHGNNLEVLLSSGFEAASTNRSAAPLATPEIKKIVNLNSGECRLYIGAIRNSKGYATSYALLDNSGTPGPWQDGPVVVSSRKVILSGLTPGAQYLLRLRALGGSTGFSLWSNATVHRMG